MHTVASLWSHCHCCKMKSSLVLVVVLAAVAAQAKVQPYVEGEYIVRVDERVIRDDEIPQLINHLSSTYQYTTKAKYSFGKLRFLHVEGLEQHLSDVRREHGIRYVERNNHVTLLQSCEPTPAPGVWGLDRIDQEDALPYTDPLSPDATYIHGEHAGAGVTAYVIDTGIELEHPEFEGRATWGYTAPGMSDEDRHSHGTHCAGTIGSASYGVARDVSMVAVKVVNALGFGTVSDFLGGMEWILEDHLRRQDEQGGTMPKSLISASLLYGSEQSIDDSVQEVVDAGIVMVAGAGNDDADACTGGSPAQAPASITVGATSVDDVSAYFTNYGPCVDIFAPGVDILSTVLDGETDVYSGTSMATPHVAGVVAKYMSSQPEAPTPQQVDTWLKENGSVDKITWFNDRHSSSTNLLLRTSLGC